MKKMKQFFVLSFLLYCFFNSGKAQNPVDSLSRYYVLMKDKNIFYGKILERTKKTILFETESVGEVNIRLRKVLYIEPFRSAQMIDSIYYPKYRFPHHNTFTPTGEIGQSYYQNTVVYWNSFNYRLSKNASLGGGTFPLIGNGFEGFAFWLSPKVKIPLKTEKIKMSIGYFGLLLPSSGITETSKDKRVGIVYGAMTTGGEFYRLSAGLGTGMGAGEFYKWPFYTTSILFRVKSRSFLRFEVMGGGDFGSFSEVSFRTMSRKATWDIGWLFPANKERIELGAFYGGPYFSVLYTMVEY